jgi:hypothetical protein
MKNIWILALCAGALAAPHLAAAAPSYVGSSGLVITPDDRTLGQNDFSLAWHHVERQVFGGAEDLNIYTLNYGVTAKGEIGGSYVTNDQDRWVLNGKYRLLDERAGSPAVTVGVADLFNELDDGVGAYALLTKTLTGFGVPEGGEPEVGPFRVHLGLGTGFYSSIFAGADWAPIPKLTVLAEYAPKGPLTGRDAVVNLGARYALTDNVRADVALLDFDNVGFGLSYTRGLR